MSDYINIHLCEMRNKKTYANGVISAGTWLFWHEILCRVLLKRMGECDYAVALRQYCKVSP